MTGDVGSELFECVSVFVGGLLLSCLFVDFVEGVAEEVVVDYFAEAVHQ